MAKPAAVKKEPVEEKKKAPVVAKKQPRSVVGRVYDYTSPIFKYGAIATAGLAGSVLAPGLLLNPITGAAIGAGTLAYLSGEKTLGKALIAGGTPYLVKDLRDYNINRELLETGISEAGRGSGRNFHITNPDIDMEGRESDDTPDGPVDTHMVDEGGDRKRRRSLNPDALLEETMDEWDTRGLPTNGTLLRRRPKMQEYVAQPIEIPKFLLDFGSSQNKGDFILREAVNRFNAGRFNRFNF